MTKPEIPLILKESYRWRHRKLIEFKGFEEPVITWGTIFINNIVYAILGSFFAVFFSKFINTDFAGYTITALSIFIGLFTSVLLMIIDKYTNHSYHNIENPSSSQKLDFKRSRNFSRRFTFVCLEALIIAITIIIILLFPLMAGKDFLVNLNDFEFTTEITGTSIKILLINSLIFFSRTVLFILLIKFFSYLFYIFRSLASYLEGIFTRKTRI